MNNKIPALSQFRMRDNIELKDLAYLLNVDPSNLAKYERGKRTPNPLMILAYHILFDAPLHDLFADLYADLYAQVTERSQELIAKIKKSQSPNSIYKLGCIRKIVNRLNHNWSDV